MFAVKPQGPGAPSAAIRQPFSRSGTGHGRLGVKVDARDEKHDHDHREGEVDDQAERRPPSSAADEVAAVLPENASGDAAWMAPAWTAQSAAPRTRGSGRRELTANRVPSMGSRGDMVCSLLVEW